MSTERYDVPKEIGTLVTGQDPKQMILNRFGDRERFWEQKFQSLQCLYNEQKESNARKDESISQLSQQLNRISTSSQRNNPERAKPHRQRQHKHHCHRHLQLHHGRINNQRLRPSKQSEI